MRHASEHRTTARTVPGMQVLLVWAAVACGGTAFAQDPGGAGAPPAAPAAVGRPASDFLVDAGIFAGLAGLAVFVICKGSRRG